MAERLEDLSAAWDEVEEATEEQQGEEQPLEGTEEPQGELFEEASEEAEAGGEELEAVTSSKPTEKAGDDKPVESSPEEKAPVSWGVATREHWGKLPKEVKAEIMKRERDFAVGIQRYSENSKRAELMDRALQPFQQYFAMNGNQPGQTIQQLLQTASVLQMGAPGQKAQMVAQLINQFGVDIQTLDNLLAGEEPPPEAQQQQHVQQAIQQAVAPYQQMLNQFQQAQVRQRQAQAQAAGSEIQKFAADSKHEFYNDVRADMADLLDMAANRGINLTLKDAYDRACMMHPEISRVITSRRQQEQLRNKRRAATSISGSPAGSAGSAPPDSIAAALEYAWENSGRT